MFRWLIFLTMYAHSMCCNLVFRTTVVDMFATCSVCVCCSLHIIQRSVDDTDVDFDRSTRLVRSYPIRGPRR
ncbi:hypothetical protein L210DRAFT_3551229 [Boletus edulis BED1]|uniref:Secreted protein n=1 Tax=Boletus edulis BED1 TaxID=1328754 RepID=A0AAD4BNY8_BOLED|nr:hypothetical protein L210DRAFT_3551229 [Boletus edulis BED1]